MYPSNKKKKVWREEKERLLKMTLEERRKEYIRDYVPLNTILSWKEEMMKGKSQNDEENTQETSQLKKSLSEKVSLYRGDITLLEVDAIVNADIMETNYSAKTLIADLFGSTYGHWFNGLMEYSVWSLCQENGKSIFNYLLKKPYH
ncbi:ADP-ribose glycohydrolase MACROD2-like [Suricata suricatta]|uniref:ADP-ribose glycohydrolase MACROD2-like n=1 Tax=Suricata suricatta TaxID=37032 RepID=UPI001155AD43|nr:ADP-ribose glycohydrolase MACROD2-like [Suricata suricatta]